MILSIHSGAFVDSAWPKTWPPFKLPPPAPLDAASDSLWSPQQKSLHLDAVGVESNQAVVATSSLYSSQLSAEDKAGEGRFEMAPLDQRIALMRYDASHTGVAA